MASIATSAPEVLIAAAAQAHPSDQARRRRHHGAESRAAACRRSVSHARSARTRAHRSRSRSRTWNGSGRGRGRCGAAIAMSIRSSPSCSPFERGGFPASHPFGKIEPMPSDVKSGTLWMLGSTLAGASIAAGLGVPYAFAGHFAMAHAIDAIKHYKARFEPSPSQPKPYAMLAVTAVCAPTDEEATRLAAPLRVAIVKNRTGRRAPIVSIEEALAYQFSDDELAIAGRVLSRCGDRLAGDRREGHPRAPEDIGRGRDHVVSAAAGSRRAHAVASAHRAGASIAFTISIASGLSRLVRSPLATPVTTRSRSTRRMILPERVRGTVETT